MGRTLEDLLCVIHRDGGDYIAANGVQKAFDDALKIHYRQRDCEEELLQRLKDAEKELWFFRTFSELINEKNIKSIVFELERHAEGYFRKYPEPVKE